MLVPITSIESPTACVSFNYHRDLFGRSWGIRTSIGEAAHTACVGFGVERITLALLKHHGLVVGKMAPSRCAMSWATSRGNRAGLPIFHLSGLCLVVAFFALPVHAADPIVLEGTLNGANYRIDKPANWNGGLVLFAHGSEDERPGAGTISPEPLEAHLARGHYAWAASGFRAPGYHPDWFLDDTLALRDKFIQTYGQPRWTIIHGESMGGHIAIAALELHPEVFQGGLIECGVVDGIGFFDWSYAYSAAAEYFSGLPILDTPKWAFDALRLRQAFHLSDGRAGKLWRLRKALRQCRQASFRRRPPAASGRHVGSIHAALRPGGKTRQRDASSRYATNPI